MGKIGSRIGIGLCSLVVLSVMAAIGCVDYVDEPRDSNWPESQEMGEYVFDGVAELDAPERLEYRGVEPGFHKENKARLQNVGRTALKIDSLQASEHFSVHIPSEFEAQQRRLLPGESVLISVEYAAPDHHDRQGLLTVYSDDPQRGAVDIDLVVIAGDDCPTAVIEAQSQQQVVVADPDGYLQASPLEMVSFDGSESASPYGEIAEHQWTLISSPTDSFAQLEQDADPGLTELHLILAGTYVVELDVIDEEGNHSCETARIEIEAIPTDAIHVQLVWDTPGDPERDNNHGADVDLHFLHEDGQWNQLPYDCFWLNMNPDWGDEDEPEMNPSLDTDAVDGWGPENINLTTPEPGVRYGVGVHYFSDNGFGPSYATVRIYLDGQLQLEMTDQYMENGQFWQVANIDWPSQDISVRDELYDDFPASGLD